MKIVWQNVLWILLLCTYNYLIHANEKIHIGALFDEENAQVEIALKHALYYKTLMDKRYFDFKERIQYVSKTDTFASSKALCNLTKFDNGVAAIIAPESKTLSAMLQSICEFFEIPYIQNSWRPFASFESETMINLFPEANLFAQGLATIVKNLHWKSFVIVYENEEGLMRLQEVLKLQEYDKNKRQNTVIVRQLGPGPDYRTLLKEIKNSSESHIILDCESNKILPILQQAKEVKLLDMFSSFFLTSLDANTLDFTVLNTNANITTIQLFNASDPSFKNVVDNWNSYTLNFGRTEFLKPKEILVKTALIYDAVSLYIDSINDLKTSNTLHTTTESISCNETKTWNDGIPLMRYMKIKQPNSTLTGPLLFDKNGRRINFQMFLILVDRFKNERNNERNGGGNPDKENGYIIGFWSALTPDVFNSTTSEKDSEQKAIESLQARVVRVSSRLGKPYLMKRTPRDGEELQGNEKYEGYSMDLIKGIAESLNFTFEFFITENNLYGNWDPKKKEWNGLVKDLLDHRADLAICDLTITHQRREAVDFSMPFMNLGISILYTKPQPKPFNMFAFLDPFSTAVWFYTATLYLTMSVVLYFISRMAPGDWENPHPCEQNPTELENIWDIKNCLWLTLGSIMTQGCDILPKGISSRMATSMWWFFSLIMTSSYTATLAAFLTMEKMEPTIDSADALAKQTKIKYGTVKGGATQAFFRDSNYSTYQRMWLSMSTNKPSVFEDNNEKGVNRVQSQKGLYAFLMESSQIEYEIETKCDLKQVGTWLDSKGFGIAMPVNSPYRSAINKAVLKMQENGKLNELKTYWWKVKRDEPSCIKQEAETDSSKLALANVGGVFLVLGIGIAIAFILAITEFLWNVRNVSIEEHLTYWEALKIELKFASNVWITKKKTKPQISESSGSSKDSFNQDKRETSLARTILHGAGSFLNVKKLGSSLNINRT